MSSLFLLGGYDLEMLEIRHLLDRKKIPYLDKKLSWGARLSAYQSDFSEFDAFTQVYGIELLEDIPPPAHYIRIDHHNEYANRDAAILQVAKILAHPPDRRMKLIAANDSGYIPALLAMGASEAEIAEIRIADRKAQGVTPEEENAAIVAITEKKIINALTVVSFPGKRFSPVTDRLFGKTGNQLLVHNPTTFTYFGVGAQRLALKFEGAIRRGHAYYGGGPNGFFGGSQAEIPLQTIINSLLHANTSDT